MSDKAPGREHIGWTGLSHLSSVDHRCKFAIHLADRYVPQEVYPLVAEIRMPVSRYIYAVDAWVGGKQARWARPSRTVPPLRRFPILHATLTLACPKSQDSRLASTREQRIMHTNDDLVLPSQTSHLEREEWS